MATPGHHVGHVAPTLSSCQPMRVRSHRAARVRAVILAEMYADSEGSVALSRWRSAGEVGCGGLCDTARHAWLSR